MERSHIEILGAHEHNLKHLDLRLPRGKITVITGVSGSGKSSLAFDTILAESNRRFFYTLSHYSRQFLDLGSRPALRAATGLSPAIALAQNETQPSPRATVGSLTDIAELLGVLYARFAEKRCPTHDLPTEPRTLDELVSQAKAEFFGHKVVVMVAVVDQKKGQFRKILEDFQKKGFSKAWIDGELLSLEPLPQLNKDAKHSIDIVIDITNVEPSREARFRRSLETALTLGQGRAVIGRTDSTGQLQIKSRQYISLQAGCPLCSYSWPKLDTRHFSPNSLGRCLTCEGRGSVQVEIDQDAENPWYEPELCLTCAGTGLLPDLKAILFRGRSLQRMYLAPLQDLASFFAESLAQLTEIGVAQKLVLQKIMQHCQRVIDLGLGYLHIGRRIRSLSNGEAQRLRLSGILSEQLRGVLYILDEPSQGLHPKEIATINQAFRKLCDQGNTVIVVDHDPNIMRAADWIVDLGPDGGRFGGSILAEFAPSEARLHTAQSQTAQYLAANPMGPNFGRKSLSREPLQNFISIIEPRLYNLKMAQLRLPIGALTVVTGVSGAGKTSLVLRTLYRNIESMLEARGSRKISVPYACKSIHGLESISSSTLITRKPIAKSSVSMPATWLAIFTELRELYASLADAQVLGLSASAFSLAHEEGRCPECKGRGTLVLTMKFLADAAIPCPLCRGKRYKPQILEVRYGELNLAEVLELSIAEALDLFKNHRLIQRRLQPAVALGLGYLKLGQPSSSLSGGESQRLKLVPYLAKKVLPGALLILDEPTAGLHFRDVALLLTQLKALTQQGATLVVIEHDQQLINAADWVVELGPGAGEQGGELLYEGPVRLGQ